MRVHFQWLAPTLGKWLPPSAPAEHPEAGGGHGGNKRVSNRELKRELGYRFRYPTFREDYTTEIARLEAAGQLDLSPEPR